ncbi:MAG: LLM class flavin-dependent oxidoreductase [Dehalococcoidia bacterium]
MPVEFIGMIGTRSASEIDAANASLVGGHVDLEFLGQFAQAHEAAGFDRVLVGYGSSGPDGFSVAGYCASVTERLQYLIAHRPGFVQPTLAARKAATLDQLTRGRIALHIITGGNDAEMQRDGDFLTHDERYRRTDEYLEVMRKTWTSPEPFDYDGEFYRFRRAFSEVKPYQKPHVPLYYGGMSGAALPVGAKHADCYMVWGEPLADVQSTMDEVHEESGTWGRKPRFSISFRPIIAHNEEAAWEKARGYLDRIVGLRGGSIPEYRPEARGSQRLLEIAGRSEVHDDRLWTAIARAVGATGNTTALVGTPEQVAESLMRYYDAGVTTLLIRGFEPLEDAEEFGRELIPMVRAEVAKREREAAAAAP